MSAARYDVVKLRRLQSALISKRGAASGLTDAFMGMQEFAKELHTHAIRTCGIQGWSTSRPIADLVAQLREDHEALTKSSSPLDAARAFKVAAALRQAEEALSQRQQADALQAEATAASRAAATLNQLVQNCEKWVAGINAGAAQ